MNNKRIASRFIEIAERLEQTRANPYRIQAYRKAARTLLQLKEDVKTLSEKGFLLSISGIGTDLAEKIIQFLETGEIPDPSLKQEYPHVDIDSLPQFFQELISIGGIDPKIAGILYRHFYINSLDDLSRLVRSRLLRTLPHFNPNWEQKILTGIKTIER